MRRRRRTACCAILAFIGLREDKAAEAVVAETPVPCPLPVPEALPVSVKVSSRDRIVFPDSDVTKGELADYYALVAPDHAALGGPATVPSAWFAARKGAPRRVSSRNTTPAASATRSHQVPIREKDGSTEEYLWVDDADGLVDVRADGDDRVPRMGIRQRRAGEARPDGVRSRPRRRGWISAIPRRRRSICASNWRSWGW